MYKQVFKAIAQQLLAPGNCPYDDSCRYSEETCTAPTSFILEQAERHLSYARESSPVAYGGFLMGGYDSEYYNQFLWPCDNFVAIFFVSSDDYK